MPINYRKPELMNSFCDRHLNYAVKGRTNSAELMGNDFIDLAVNIHYTVVYARAVYFAFIFIYCTFNKNQVTNVAGVLRGNTCLEEGRYT